MTEREQTEHFDVELTALIRRFRLEYEMTYAAVIGTLQIKIVELVNEAQDDEEDE